MSPAEVRSLIGTPLRGELTLPASNIPTSLSQSTRIDNSLDNIQGVLSQVVRLATTRSQTPHIVVSPDPENPQAAEATAPWSWTAAEATVTEVALYPFLMHIAAARDDLEGITFCLESHSLSDREDPELRRKTNMAIRGGIVDCIDPASGRSPLHVAALNGSTRCVAKLLESGALVHLRDNLGHTALYYVRYLSRSPTYLLIAEPS